MLLRRAGLQIRKSGSAAGPGIKIRTEVVQIRVPSPYPSKNGRIRTLILLYLYLFFFNFNAFEVIKERCKEKSKKQKANSKSNPDFFLWYRCVLLWCWPIFSLSQYWPFLSLCCTQWPRQPTWTGPNVCCVPVPVGGNAVRVGSSSQTRIRSPD